MLFVRPADCKKYFDATLNGIQYPGQPERFIAVELCPAEFAGENVKEIIDRAMTRCVRVIDLGPDWTKLALNRIAAGTGKNSRVVDSVVCGKTVQGVSAYFPNSVFEFLF